MARKILGNMPAVVSNVHVQLGGIHTENGGHEDGDEGAKEALGKFACVGGRNFPVGR